MQRPFQRESTRKKYPLTQTNGHISLKDTRLLSTEARTFPSAQQATLRTAANAGEVLSLSRPLSASLAGICLFTILALCPLPRSVQARPESNAHDPNAVCAPCHREIYQRYRNTPMANASGPAVDGFIPADFLHPASGI